MPSTDLGSLGNRFDGYSLESCVSRGTAAALLGMSTRALVGRTSVPVRRTGGRQGACRIGDVLAWIGQHGDDPGALRDAVRALLAMLTVDDDPAEECSVSWVEGHLFALFPTEVPQYEIARDGFERAYGRKLRDLCGGNVRAMARMSGVDRSTIKARCAKYDISLRREAAGG